jgi:hypothetical protein
MEPMTSYEIWCNLKDTSRDLQFCRDLQSYLGLLKARGLIQGFRIRRRKLGFGPAELGEFNITIEVADLAQLEQAFQQVAAREGEIEAKHHAVYSQVTDFRAALYRDFPDPVRVGVDRAG